MRKTCPNFDRENALETVLEVPIPEEMFVSMGSNANHRWQNLRARMMRVQGSDSSDDRNNNNSNHPSSSSSSSSNNSASHLSSGSSSEFMALLKLVGSPLIPFQFQPGYSLTRSVKDGSIVSF
ncbi:hypothetical protein MLD38_012920 [Melastoma candidum]|uniref:Uncharacterized protein n=1 Tax=Melastoma candidum TaxID=119954 RepID=A0ACB9R7W3_9MYRT|nr:hypothetical protein MLD38_012920 [Melastoma candidum]